MEGGRSLLYLWTSCQSKSIPITSLAIQMIIKWITSLSFNLKEITIRRSIRYDLYLGGQLSTAILASITFYVERLKEDYDRGRDTVDESTFSIATTLTDSFSPSWGTMGLEQTEHRGAKALKRKRMRGEERDRGRDSLMETRDTMNSILWIDSEGNSIQGDITDNACETCEEWW